MFCYIKNMYDICSQNMPSYTQIYEKTNKYYPHFSGKCLLIYITNLNGLIYEKNVLESFAFFIVGNDDVGVICRL